MAPTPLLKKTHTSNKSHEVEYDLYSDHEPIQLRKSEINWKQIHFLKDFHCNTILHTNSNSSQVLYPLSHILSYHNICLSHFHFIYAIIVCDEPSTHKQVVKHPHWIQAMNFELDALNQNCTWTISDLPPAKKPIGCK